MVKLSLNGKWTASGGDFSNVKGTVPGCIHTDLLNNGLIEDPYYRDNESKYMHLGETDWSYEREFYVSEELLDLDNITLMCYGLDTFSAISINGIEVDWTDNMFREWHFDVKDLLVLGENLIVIQFYSTFPYIKEKLEERYLNITGIDNHRLVGSNYVRKMQCNYGWDWGPKCVTAGIWRDIELIGYNCTRIDNVQIKQEHRENEVELEIRTNLINEIRFNKAYIKVEISFQDEKVQQLIEPICSKHIKQKIIIRDPQKWWPNNLGEQNLYDVKVTILNDEKIIDVKQERIGLRTLILDRHPDEYGESFQFVVNGIPFFAKGANWIPIDTFVTRGTDEFYEELLVDAKEANMNFIRVWGGGIYEKNRFYELCDELGLCVWQDFMFACSAYPVYDELYMDTVREEIKDNVKRIRNHASLALWCGNNEIEYMGSMVSDDGSNGTMTWDEYDKLFGSVIPSVIDKYDGQHDYWASSPMDGPGSRGDAKDPTRGDAHLWDVWHGLKPFEWYRTCDHRFNSEFGFQSFPEPEVVRSYTAEEDRNIASFVMEKHQRSGIGNTSIIHYMMSWFKLPTNFDMLMWTSQILQSLAIKYAVENWRRKMPRGMGTLYWQLNDCWPVASWSSIDSTGNFKALQYSAKKFFNPILISGIEDKKASSLELFLSNDTLQDVEGIIKWRVYNLDGEVVEENSMEAIVQKNSSSSQKLLELKTYFGSLESARRHVVTYLFEVNGQIVSENTTFFKYPKHLMLEKPTFDVVCESIKDRQFKVSITTDKPSFWVWMDVKDTKAKYSDRFFDLFNKDKKEVVVTTKDEISLSKFKEKLFLNSIYDTYQV